MNRLFIAGIAAAAFCGVPALAADMVVKAPKAPTPVLGWTGCYLGGEVGYAGGRSHHDFSNGAPSDNSDPRGGLGGGLVGCNYQMSNVVLGIEGDYEAANLTGSFINQTGATSSGSTNMTSDGSVRGRLGVVVWDRSLLYVTGGWAFAHYNIMGGPGFGFGVPVPCCGYSSNPDGWTAGVGWEYAFAPDWTARVEYRHADYGTSSGGLPPTFPTVIMTVRNTTDAVRLAVTYKFSAFLH
jgi:outer membrane immunogenic protein